MFKPVSSFKPVYRVVYLKNGGGGRLLGGGGAFIRDNFCAKSCNLFQVRILKTLDARSSGRSVSPRKKNYAVTRKLRRRAQYIYIYI